MRNLRFMFVILAGCLIVAADLQAKKPDQPFGLVAASRGQVVVLVNPTNGVSAEIETGPVGLLFPAPGGLLFAPDLVHGRTTVIDLRAGQIGERLDGVTMPWFGQSRDRYLVLGSQIQMVSYPERAQVYRVPVEVANPFQVMVAGGASAVLILCRRPDISEEPTHLVAIDLNNRKLVYDSLLSGNVVSMSFLSSFGLLALSDRGGAAVVVIDPSTRLTAGEFPTNGWPVETALLADGKTLAVAEVRAAEPEGGETGAVLLWKLKARDDTLVVKKRQEILLPGAPVRMSIDPTGRWLAVALTNGNIVIVDSEERAVVATAEGSGVARDLRWCDPTIEGPSLEKWSDGDAAELEFGAWR